MKGERYESDNWDARNKELSDNEICVAIKDIILSSMQDDLEDNQEDYCSLDHEYWRGFLYTIVKDNMKRVATQIKRLTTSRASSNSDSNESVRGPFKKRVRTGVIPNHKQQGKKTPKYYAIQRYCEIFKKARMSEKKYMPYSSENCLENAPTISTSRKDYKDT